MKEVIAIIRTEKWTPTREAIEGVGVVALVHHRVIGRGRQKGLRYLRRSSAGGGGDMPYLPKRIVRCLVEDGALAALVAAIIKTNQTGNLGDGKIFVSTVEVAEPIEAVAAAEATLSPAVSGA